jgi:beta-galactosidase
MSGRLHPKETIHLEFFMGGILRICVAVVLSLAAAGALAQPAAPGNAAAPATVRQTLNFDAGWRFYKGEPPAPAPAQPLSPNYAPIDPASFAFKDGAWQAVDLPHDWSIDGPFAKENPSTAAGGYLPTGVAWYRKTFTVPADAKGKRVFIEFDGVMSNSEVYINKGVLGQRPNGWVPFSYDMTDYINWGGENLLAVRTDTSRQPASRSYTGSGINRHVKLVIQNAVHLAHQSIYVTTPKIAANSATVRVQATVVNQSASPQTVKVAATIHGPAGSAPDGAYANSSESPELTLAPGHSADVTLEVPLNWAPALWSIDKPDLHTADVRVLAGGNVVDDESVHFGVRTAEFKADTGFWLNGKNIKLLGMALHSDVGALGMAVPMSAWETRLTTLKKLGVNAIRTAHNPMPEGFYDACDRLGLMVMDEAFDVWTIAKEPADYHLYFRDWWQKDLDAMIKRDRNHPSIVIWSLGNEIWDILPQNPDPAADQFVGPNRSIDLAKAIFAPLRDRAHELDPTRPVTIAQLRPSVAGAYNNGFADMMDVIGQNYRDNELAAAHRQNPARKIIGTENYKTRDTWVALRDNPALSGQFIWAGVDYIGESGDWPNVVSPSGIVDRTNWLKGDALEREAWWSDKPVVHIARMLDTPTRPGRPNVMMGFPDWTPAQSAAHTETVSVFSNCDEVELFLNDKSLGTKPKDRGDAARQWKVEYAPGVIRAVAKNKGQVAGTDELRTAGAVAKVVLQAERTTLPHDFEDVVYVRAFLADAQGTRNPNATDKVTFQVTGPGAIVAVDNGDLKSHEPFHATERSAYQGTCVAIVRATADAGTITLTASAPGAAAGSVTLTAAPPAR